jgi:hypothetical protein
MQYFDGANSSNSDQKSACTHDGGGQTLSGQLGRDNNKGKDE